MYKKSKKLYEQVEECYKTAEMYQLTTVEPSKHLEQKTRRN